MSTSKPHAVRVPISFAGGGGAFSKLSKLHTEFATILQSPRIHVRHQGVEHFITDDPSDTLNYPGDDSAHGESRYEWADRGDGVLYGYLRREA